MVPGHQGENEGKFPGLGQGHSGLGGHAKGIPQEPRHGGHDQELHSQKQKQEYRERGKMVQEEPDIHEHADGNEKEAVQGVPEGEDVGKNLESVFRFGDDQPRDEGPSARESPATELAKAVPRTTRMTAMRKTSRLRVPTTSRRKGGMANFAAMTMAPTVSTETPST